MGLLTDWLGYNPISAALGQTSGNTGFDNSAPTAPTPPADIPGASPGGASPIDKAFATPQGTDANSASLGMSPAERDLAIRTLYGEAGGEGPGGQAAVAHVIKNRVMSGGYGSSVNKVITAPSQFSLWNPGDPAGDRARALDPNSQTYQNLGNIVDGVFGGTIKDPTGGADHYYNPHTSSPSWGDKLATKNDVTIGNHRFVGKVIDRSPTVGVDDTASPTTPSPLLTSTKMPAMAQAFADVPGGDVQNGYNSLSQAQRAKLAGAAPVSLANPTPAQVAQTAPGGGGFGIISPAEAATRPPMTQALDKPAPPEIPIGDTGKDAYGHPIVNGHAVDVNGRPIAPNDAPNVPSVPVVPPQRGPQPAPAPGPQGSQTVLAPLPPARNVPSVPVASPVAPATPPMHTAIANPNPAPVAPKPAAPVAPTATPTAPESNWHKFGTGGLGALFGIPHEGARPFDLGTALTKAGIALSSRDNPQGAQAMAAIPSMEARAWVPRFSNVNFNPVTGQQVGLDTRTGELKVTPAAKGYQSYVPMSDKARDEFNENDEHISQELETNLPALRSVQEKLRTGKLDPSLFSRTKAQLDLLASNGDDNARELATAQHWLSLKHQEYQRGQVGVQTDKDAENAMHALMPGQSQYDPKAMAQALDNVIKSASTDLKSHIRAQQGAITTYGKQIPQNIQERSQTYQNYAAKLDADQAHWDKVSAPWFAEPAATAPPPKNNPRYSGSHDQSGGQGSFAEGQTRSNVKTGQRQVWSNGAWWEVQ